jgi:O-succinylbenzoate synthase
VTRCLELAERAGLPVVVSSALESSVGLGAGLALAAALPELPHACGLATATLLTGDLVEQPLHAEGGLLPVERRDPSEELLTRHAADAQLIARWEERLAACAAQL